MILQLLTAEESKIVLSLSSLLLRDSWAGRYKTNKKIVKTKLSSAYHFRQSVDENISLFAE